MASRSVRRLAGLLAGAGAAHFAAPRLFDGIVPRALPGSARTWTYLSGAAELATAAAVAHPRTRRAGSLAAAGLFVAVLPANVQMARDWRTRPAPLRAAASARVPAQIPLVLWGLYEARRARRAQADGQGRAQDPAQGGAESGVLEGRNAGQASPTGSRKSRS
ncbi:hypothetical protein [Streptomyces sp. ODS28]|uniref:DoxX family protein n=1 Tax=Streptomyces sp. ODS28 TaxID=3136688 RepID=UPI0031E67887